MGHGIPDRPSRSCPDESTRKLAMPSRLPTEEKVALTRKVLQVLANWKLEPMDQCELLGLPTTHAGQNFRRLRMGASLPDDTEIWTRVALLLRLDNAVRQVFPHSALSADLWVTSPNPRCSHQTPLAVMLAGGLEGIRQVERSVDNLDPLSLASMDLIKKQPIDYIH
jgi:hypothetical protein